MSPPLYSIPGPAAGSAAPASLAPGPEVTPEQAQPPRTVNQVLAQSQVLGVIDELEHDLIGLAPVK